VIATLLAQGDPTWLERSIFDLLHGLPDPIGAGLVAIAPLGSGLAVFAATLLAAVFDREAAWQLWLAGGLAWLAANLAKLVVGRPRPQDLLDLQGIAFDGGGYPSGHTAVAVALVTALWPWLSTTGRIVAGLLAAGVGLARLHMGAHLPLDVIGGALLGLLVGLAVRAVLAGSRR